MSKPRTADAAGYFRRKAVSRVKAGFTQAAVARILGIGERTLRRWVSQDRNGGEAALSSRIPSGRPPKLDEHQGAAVLEWLTRSPREFGFVTERWTAPRLAELIRREWGVAMNHRYLNRWLTRRGITPQIPARQAQERDEQSIGWWVSYVWPHIKKGA